ncbi:hypothetical protein P20652_0976 [Pseudoalteromonas sp. BSi20652]|nr:hypothetical protein P20652_0976 [Pseudoalteromonas sp. BSi20652]
MSALSKCGLIGVIIAYFLKQKFVKWAGFYIRYSFWAKAYYAQHKDKGKPHNGIIKSLAFK